MIRRLLGKLWRLVFLAFTAGHRMRCPRCAEATVVHGGDGQWRCTSCGATVPTWPT